MAFAYDGKYLPRITSYDSAHRFWERAQHWRGQDDEHDARVLDSKRKKNVTIRKLRDNSIACRLHHTDVVTFHPDNTMTVKPWRSVSTDEFFNRLVGSFTGVIAWFNSGLIRAGDKLYTAHDTLKLDCASGRLLSETPPFKIRTINRKTDGRLDPAQTRAIVFVLDGASVKVGTRGRIWIADLGGYR